MRRSAAVATEADFDYMHGAARVCEQFSVESPDELGLSDKPAARKILADLNKQEGTNKAAELIKAAGYGKLSEVPDDALAGIVEQAEQLLGRA